MTDEGRDPVAANRERWEALAAVNPDTELYREAIETLLAGESTLAEPERAALGSVSGASVCHLQCHVGVDTLSIAREAATVVGVDFSQTALATARDLRAETDLEATFVRADASDAGNVLDRAFDAVFASLGVLSWVPDVRAWTESAAALTRSGGRLALVDAHPVLAGFDWHLEPAGSYFRAEPRRHEEASVYADPETTVDEETYYTWQHGLGEVVTAVAEAGFRVETLREYPRHVGEAFGDLRRDAAGRLRLPEDPLPGTFGLVARRD